MGVLTLTKHTAAWWLVAIWEISTAPLQSVSYRVHGSCLPVPLLLDALEFAVTEDALDIPGHHSSPRTWLHRNATAMLT